MPRASPAIRNASQFLAVRTARSSWSERTDPSRAHSASRRSMAADRPIVYRDAALADGAGPSLRKGVSVLVRDRRIVWIRPTSDEGTLPRDVRIIDAGGSTIVPGMVDAHSHLTLPGGSHWIDRGADPPEELLQVAEHNGDLLGRAGVRWARDVGSPLAVDPRDGRRRALAPRVRGRWGTDPNRPRVRGAGTWSRPSGGLTGGARNGAGDGPAPLQAAATPVADPGDVPREHPGDLPLLGLLRADDDVAPIRQRRGEGADRTSPRAGDRERATRPPRRGADRDRDRLRRRIVAGEPPRLGGRGARRG